MHKISRKSRITCWWVFLKPVSLKIIQNYWENTCGRIGLYQGHATLVKVDAIAAILLWSFLGTISSQGYLY